MKYISRSEEDTIHLAQNIESEKFPNMVICLNGDLGTGKTLFTKAFADAMGIKEHVTSPTFNIVKEYTSGELPLYHMDVYRLDGNVDGLGIEEYFEKGGVVIIEWADTIEEYLPDERLDLTFIAAGENSRIIKIDAYSEVYENIAEESVWYFILILLGLLCI